MQHSSAGASTAAAAVPAIAALPLLQLQTVPPGFPTPSPAAAFLLHDVQSLQQSVLPLHLASSNSGAGSESGQVELDKQAIYRHPLFPLLASLFEKCEKATANVDGQVTNDSFNVDIEMFVRNQEVERKPFFSDDPEVDNLMVKAIQVLRIHLLELEKVNELCKDFCSRYISCLRAKLSSGSLLKSDSSSDTEDSECHVNGSIHEGGSSAATSAATAAAMCLGQGAQLVSGGTVFQMVQTSQGLVAQPVQIQTAPAILHGAGVGSSAGAMHLTHFGLAGPGAVPASGGAHTSLMPGSLTAEQQTLALASLAAMDEDDDDDDMNASDNVVRSIGGTGGGTRAGKSKRGVLPKQATLIMKSWLFQHIVHPYPTEDEKRQIAAQTNLTLLQVNNWFINARRRILQPMLDASNPDQAKSKKSKGHGGGGGGRPMQRFWPESMASLQSHRGGSGSATGSSGTVPDSGASTAASMLAASAAASSLKPSDMLFKCGISSAAEVGNSGGSALHPLTSGPLLYPGGHVEGIGLHERAAGGRRQHLLSGNIESADDGSSSGAALSE